jgi:hypothetical protein
MLHRRSASQQVDPSPERQRRKIVGVGWRDSLLPLGKEELEVVSSADVPTQAAETRPSSVLQWRRVQPNKGSRQANAQTTFDHHGSRSSDDGLRRLLHVNLR